MKRMEQITVALFSAVGVVCLVQAINAWFIANHWETLDASGWASWVQAIGSIAAIVYAVRIANRDRDVQKAEKIVFAVLQGQSMKYQLDDFLYMARHHGENLTARGIFDRNMAATPLLDWFSKQPMWTTDEISLLAALPDNTAVDFAKAQATIRAAIVEMHYARSVNPPRSDAELPHDNRMRRAEKAVTLYWKGLDLFESVRRRIPDALPGTHHQWW